METRTPRREAAAAGEAPGRWVPSRPPPPATDCVVRSLSRRRRRRRRRRRTSRRDMRAGSGAGSVRGCVCFRRPKFTAAGGLGGQQAVAHRLGRRSAAALRWGGAAGGSRLRLRLGLGLGPPPVLSEKVAGVASGGSALVLPPPSLNGERPGRHTVPQSFSAGQTRSSECGCSEGPGTAPGAASTVRSSPCARRRPRICLSVCDSTVHRSALALGAPRDRTWDLGLSAMRASQHNRNAVRPEPSRGTPGHTKSRSSPKPTQSERGDWVSGMKAAGEPRGRRVLKHLGLVKGDSAGGQPGGEVSVPVPAPQWSRDAGVSFFPFFFFPSTGGLVVFSPQ
ncbi:uncharacterized protein LOC132535623 [Erinaceus europaeus]|uniref:Uncharacterized protein LOC132535623 n=1 Tax=Erinaceus europaeus TaxID=9365 RepID=A0ABM3WNS1_ERIEU|nr:uncharacterized protein LOC132535623 [Erinaceus europaeus]